jgi:hypothetical protein
MYRITTYGKKVKKFYYPTAYGMWVVSRPAVTVRGYPEGSRGEFLKERGEELKGSRGSSIINSR